MFYLYLHVRVTEIRCYSCFGRCRGWVAATLTILPFGPTVRIESGVDIYIYIYICDIGMHALLKIKGK